MDFISCEKDISFKIKYTLNALEEEWNLLSLPHNKQSERRESVKKLLFNVCDKIVFDEQNIRKQVLSRIKSNKSEIEQLCLELCITVDEPDSSPPLLELDSQLQEKLKDLKSKKEEKLSELRNLVDVHRELCEFLNEKKFDIADDVLPSAEKWDLFKKQVDVLQKEKAQRRADYCRLRSGILDQVEALEKKLTDEFLLEIACSNEPRVISVQFLTELRERHEELTNDSEELKRVAGEWRRKISDLSDRLGIPQRERISVPSSHGPSSIAKLESIYGELLEIRRENLSQFIVRVREDLEDVWAQCYVSDQEKEAFLPLFDGEASEEALERLEAEVDKWRRFFEENRVILKQVDNFLEVFDSMTQLEEKLKDPARLFNTRGGALLQEEKERKKVRSELPRIQDKLINLCSAYEVEKGRPFAIDGGTMDEYFTKIWYYHDQQREKDKQERCQSQSTSSASSSAASSTTTKPSNGGGFLRSRLLKSASKRTPCPVTTPSSTTASLSCRKRARDVETDPGTPRCPTSAKRPALGPQPLLSASSKNTATTPFRNTVQGNTKYYEQADSKFSELPKYPVTPLSERNFPVPSVPKFMDDPLQCSISYENFKESLKSKKENPNSTVLSFAPPQNAESNETVYI